jgi:hypothetical protein
MLIGFMGTKGSGKDTSADYLVRTRGFIKKSFADPLKLACKQLFLFTDTQLYGTIEQKEQPDKNWFGCSPRKALQFVGTELLRNNLNEIMPGLGKNIFTHHFKLWYKKKLAANPYLCVVIADVRFQNEVDMIQELGGRVCKITRSACTAIKNYSIIDELCDECDGHHTEYIQYTQHTQHTQHESELELQKITTHDYAIENDSTIDELYVTVSNLSDEIASRHNHATIASRHSNNRI